MIGPEFKFNLRGKVQLEKKEDMRRRGLASPDIADALALTFARHVFPRAYDDWTNSGQSNVISDYDPFTFDQEQSKTPRYYAPGWARLREEYE